MQGVGYSDEEKSRAVRAVMAGTPASEVAKRYGCTAKTVRRWAKSAQAPDAAGAGASDREIAGGKSPGAEIGDEKSGEAEIAAEKSPSGKSEIEDGKSPGPEIDLEKSPGAEIAQAERAARKAARRVDLGNPLAPFNDPGIGERLTRVMEERGVSAAELSRRTGVSRKTVALIASGKSNGNVATVRAFARALGCSIDDIVEGR